MKHTPTGFATSTGNSITALGRQQRGIALMRRTSIWIMWTRVARQAGAIAGVCWIATGAACWSATVGAADTAQQLLERYAEQAKAADAAFEGFSAERGRTFYLQKHALMGVGAVSCASCHRKNPREQIKAHRVDILCRACHVINDEEHPEPKEAKVRYIEPFAPHAHPQRFSDYAHVEKFFKLNCTMVLKRECSALEKGDLIAWLLTVEGEALYPAGRAAGPVRAEE
jgi:hypothetical protein